MVKFAETHPDRSVRILIADDDPLRGNGVANLLQEMGFDAVGPISTEAEAVALVKTQRLDLALVNPSLFRTGVGRAIARMLEQVQRLPCVFMVEADDHILKAELTGPYSSQFLDLPLRPTQVLLVVENALNRQLALNHAA